MQDNESDCGLFLLHYIHKFVESAPKTMKASDLDGDFEVLGVVGFSNQYIYISVRLSVAALLVGSRSFASECYFFAEESSSTIDLDVVVL